MGDAGGATCALALSEMWVTFGRGSSESGEARDKLRRSLLYAAGARLRRGELLPLPDGGSTAAEAYNMEEVTVLP
jgi:hypothetical protein